MAIAATGFFDGVHTGHISVLKHLVSLSDQLNQQSIVVTFWPHPRSVLQQDADKLRLLTSMSEKETLLKQSGVDSVVVIPFSKSLSKLTTAQFLVQLRDKYDVTSLVIGYDHKIGCDGSSVSIADECRKVGIIPYPVEELTGDGFHISSTTIRQFLGEGMIEKANLLLGYEYSLSGVVVSGNKLGRKIGFPTANIQLYEPLKLVPANGVYEVDVLFDGREYKGVCNIGTRPTFYDNGAKTIETHILGFDEDIYGLPLTISFRTRIREEKKFSSMGELKLQIVADKARVIEKCR